MVRRARFRAATVTVVAVSQEGCDVVVASGDVVPRIFFCREEQQPKRAMAARRRERNTTAKATKETSSARRANLSGREAQETAVPAGRAEEARKDCA